MTRIRLAWVMIVLTLLLNVSWTDQWKCAHCQTVNQGSDKNCQHCGDPK